MGHKMNQARKIQVVAIRRNAQAGFCHLTQPVALKAAQLRFRLFCCFNFHRDGLIRFQILTIEFERSLQRDLMFAGRGGAAGLDHQGCLGLVFGDRDFRGAQTAGVLGTTRVNSTASANPYSRLIRTGISNFPPCANLPVDDSATNVTGAGNTLR